MDKISIKLTKEQSDDLILEFPNSYFSQGKQEITEIEIDNIPNQLKIHYNTYKMGEYLRKNVYIMDNSQTDFKHTLKIITPLIRDHKINNIL